MQFFDQLNEHLRGTQSPLLEVRQNAENQIRACRDEDPKRFMATLTKEIADESNDVGSRQMACIIFKNFISNKSKDTMYENYWINLEEEIKQQMKEAIVSQLASPQALVRTQIANVVATIAAIEIPRKQWEELIPNLCGNAEHQDFNVRLSSLTTLGYICEEIDVDDVIDPIKNKIISALINNIVLDGPQVSETCKIAVKSLSKSVPFAAQNFKIENERDYIMQKIFQAIEMSNDEDVITCGLECIRDISTQEYESLHFYFTKICEVTYACSINDSPKVSAQSFEFWTTLIEDETERVQKNVFCQNYVAGCTESLLKMILQGISVINFEEDDDEEEWGHAMSASCCLQKLAMLIKNDVVSAVVTYAGTNLQMPGWKAKYSGLLALGSITEGPEKTQFAQVIGQALASLMQLCKDQSAKVRKAVVWVIGKICEHHAEVIATPAVSQELLPLLTAGLKDTPPISEQCCAALAGLATSCEPVEGEPANCLTPGFQEILATLLTNSERQDCQSTGVNLQQASLMTMTTLVQTACTDSREIIFQLLLPILQRLESTITSQGHPENLQDLLCGLLQVILYHVGSKVDDNLQKNITSLLIKLFQQAGRVTEGGLIAFQGVVGGIGEKVDISEIGCYLKYALESQDDDCARLACGIIQDLSESMGAGLTGYLADFVPCLCNILRSATTDKKIKLPALQALGALSLYQGDDYNKSYLDDTLVIFNSAAEMSTNVSGYPADDFENLDFCRQLREHLIEQYATLVLAVGETEDSTLKAKLQQSLPNICDFLEKAVALDAPQMTADDMKAVAGLMIDMATQNSKDQILKERLQRPYVTALLTALSNQPDSDSKETASQTYDLVRKM